LAKQHGQPDALKDALSQPLCLRSTHSNPHIRLVSPALAALRLDTTHSQHARVSRVRPPALSVPWMGIEHVPVPQHTQNKRRSHENVPGK
jgi:hypothetical protein